MHASLRLEMLLQRIPSLERSVHFYQLCQEAELASSGLKFGKRILQKIFLQLNFVGGYQKHEGRVGD